MEFNERIDKILANLDTVVQMAQSESAQKIFIELQNRIFDKGEAQNNSQIGTYNLDFAVMDEKTGTKVNYIKLRQSKGLQTGYVDLTFSGSLSMSITSNENKVYFQNTYGQTISKANEKNFKKTIFRATKDEKQIYFDTLNQELKLLFKG